MSSELGRTHNVELLQSTRRHLLALLDDVDRGLAELGHYDRIVWESESAVYGSLCPRCGERIRIRRPVATVEWPDGTKHHVHMRCVIERPASEE